MKIEELQGKEYKTVIIYDTSYLQSLKEDLKTLKELKYLTTDVKWGLEMAIEQIERYLRGELDIKGRLNIQEQP